jgi:hypothetical protein
MHTDRLKIWAQPLLIAGILVMAVPGHAEMKKVAQSGLQFLKIGVGSQMAAQGEAGIAKVDDINALFWNPAGLALMQENQFLFTYNRWIADIKQSAVAVGLNLGRWGNFGLSCVYMDYGEFYPTVRNPDDQSLTLDAGFLEPGNVTGSDYFLDTDFKPLDVAVGIAYARQFTDRFWMGWHVRLVHENLGKGYIQRTDFDGDPLEAAKIVENKLTNIATDFGVVYKPGVGGIRFAMAFQNFGPEMKYQHEEFPLPVTFRVGLTSDLSEAFHWKNPRHNLILSLDTIKPNDYTQRVHAGAEYIYHRILLLRGGYKFNYDSESFAAGFGLRYHVQNVWWSFDASYTRTDRFTSPLRFSITGQF